MIITINEVKTTLKKLSNLIIENEIYFCELDSVAGDGDFGTSLAKGFKKILLDFDTLNDESISMFLKECSLILSEYSCGATGPLWSSAFREAAKSCNNKQTLNFEDLIILLECAVNGIQKRGGANLGDKTLLDSLIPFTNTLRESFCKDVNHSEALKFSSLKAMEGAENTKNIIAKKGRATYLAERSLNHPDAGAMAVAILIDKLVNN